MHAVRMKRNGTNFYASMRIMRETERSPSDGALSQHGRLNFKPSSARVWQFFSISFRRNHNYNALSKYDKIVIYVL